MVGVAGLLPLVGSREISQNLIRVCAKCARARWACWVRVASACWAHDGAPGTEPESPIDTQREINRCHAECPCTSPSRSRVVFPGSLPSLCGRDRWRPRVLEHQTYTSEPKVLGLLDLFPPSLRPQTSVTRASIAFSRLGGPPQGPVTRVRTHRAAVWLVPPSSSSPESLVSLIRGVVVAGSTCRRGWRRQARSSGRRCRIGPRGPRGSSRDPVRNE
mgnify:FL=1